MTPPDEEGGAGRAWDLMKPGRLTKRTPEHEAAIAGWLINVSTGGPFFWWLMNL